MNIKRILTNVCTSGLAAALLGLIAVGSASAQIVGGGSVNNSCMEDLYNQFGQGGGLNCTANDVQIGAVKNVVIVDDGCTSATDTVTVDFDVEILLTAQARHDVGIYFATDGGDALTGSCSVSTLPYGPNPPFLDLDGTGDDTSNNDAFGYCSGDGGTSVANPTTACALDSDCGSLGIGFTCEEFSGSQDLCGDIDSSVSPIDTSTTSYSVTGVTFQCTDVIDNATGDLNPDGLLDPVSACTSWRQAGTNQLCLDPSAAFPGAPSKCRCDDGLELIPPIVVPANSELSVNKELTANADEDSSGTVSVNDTLSYTVTATNSGDVTLNNVVVSDDLTGASTSCAVVAPGDTCVLNTTYMVAQSDVDAGQIVNTGTADSDETPGADSTVTTPVPQTPDISIEKVLVANADEDGSATISLNDTLTYTITAMNTGNVTLTDLVVTDTLNGDSITCAAVPPGGTCVLTTDYIVMQADVDAGIIENTATADSNEAGPVSDQEDVLVPQNPALGVVKELTANADEDGSGTVSLNDTLSYTITATNTGDVTLTNVVVSDDLTGASTSCASVALGATCVLTTSYVVMQGDVDAGQIVNTGTADSDQTGPVDDMATTAVPQNPQLSIEKTLTDNADEDDSATISLNDTLTYTITATNSGNVTLNNVVVSDDLTSASTSCAVVAPADTCVLTTSYVVMQGDVDAGQIVNTGTADSDEADSVQDTEMTPVPQNPQLSVAKTLSGNADEDSSGTVSVNDTLSYTVTATNSGDVTLNNVVVSDDLTGASTSCAVVAPGDTCVLNTTYMVAQSDVDAGQIVNTGTADSDETPGADSTVTTPVPQTPDISIEKVLVANADEDGSATISLNDTLTYTITAMNTGNVTLTDLVVTDTLNGDSITCAAVPPGGTCVLTTDYIVMQADVDAGIIENTATADSNEAGPVSDQEDVLVPQNPALGVVKELTANADEDGSGTVSLNDTLSYTITATNTGDVTLTNVVVSDDLTGASTSCASVALGATCVLTTSYVVMQGDVDAGQIVNTGTADSDQTGPVDDVVSIPVPRDPALSIAKELSANADEDGSGTVTLNDTLTYTITATNSGNVTLNNVVVSDDLTGASTSCVVVAPGDTCVLTTNYIVMQGDVDAGQIVNTGTADSEETDPVDDTVTTPVVQNPALAVVKVLTANADEDSSGTVSVNDTLSYTITATNTGDITLTNVTVVDDLTGASISCAVVAPGDTCVLNTTYMVAQADSDTGQIVNTGTADSDQTGPVDDTVTTPVAQSPALALLKALTANADEDGSGSVTINDTLTYTITATNTGNITLTNVLVSDDLTAASITCPSVAPGATCVLTTNYVVTQADAMAGQIVNTGSAVSDQVGPLDDTVTVPVLAPAPAIDIRKQAEGPDSRVFNPGETVTFEIEVTNTGNVDLNNVVVTDPLTPSCDRNIGFLAVGDSVTYTCSTTLSTGAVFNKTFLDNFYPRAYDGNDGDSAFSGPWMEYDVAGSGPLAGNVLVGSNDKLWLDDYPDTGTHPSAKRSTDLSGADMAILSFDYSTHSGVDTNDAVVVEISSDGGTTYTVLETFTGFYGAVSGSRSYDISSYISANTTVRFRVSQYYGGSGETFKVDNFTIEASGSDAPQGFDNKATVNGEAAGQTVMDMDTSEVIVNDPQPSIDIRKQAEGPDSRVFNPGGTVTFEIEVTNTGNVDLTNVVVNDPLTPECTRMVGLLAVGESETYTCSTTLDSGVSFNKTFFDNFYPRAYNGNDGDTDFSGSWMEYDVAGSGPLSGNVLVGSNEKLWLDDYPDTGTHPSAWRTADLSGADTATLRFDYFTHSGVDTNDAVVVEISSNGGASYTVLETFTGFYGAVSGSRSYDITPYISANTTVRFRVSQYYGGSGETFKVDNFKIKASGSSAAEGFINKATVTAQAGDQTVMDMDTSEVIVNDPQPAIDIRKQAEGPDVRVFHPGDTVGFEIEVTNIGDADLTNVVVSDPLTPSCDRVIGNMAVGQSVTYSCSLVLDTGSDFYANFFDDFYPRSYSGNDGDTDFSGPWIEYDAAGNGASGGNVLVGSNYKLWVDDYYNTGTKSSARRTADLSGADNATLHFDFETHNGVDSNDAIVVEVSSDGGANYTVLETFTGFSGAVWGSRSYDISSYISANTTVRFRLKYGYNGYSETFKVDNFEIEASGSATPDGFVNKATVSGQFGGQSVTDTDSSEVIVENSGSSGTGCSGDDDDDDECDD